MTSEFQKSKLFGLKILLDHLRLEYLINNKQNIIMLLYMKYAIY